MKKSVFLFCLLFSSTAMSQMVDLLSNIAIQGQMSAQSAKQLKTGLTMVQQNELINKINLLIMEASLLSDKKNIQKSQFSYSLSPLEWNIEGVDHQKFALIFQNIDKQFCSKLIHSFQYQSLLINQTSKKECDDKNSLKFIF